MSERHFLFVCVGQKKGSMLFLSPTYWIIEWTCNASFCNNGHYLGSDKHSCCFRTNYRKLSYLRHMWGRVASPTSIGHEKLMKNHTSMTLSQWPGLLVSHEADCTPLLRQILSIISCVMRALSQKHVFGGSPGKERRRTSLMEVLHWNSFEKRTPSRSSRQWPKWRQWSFNAGGRASWNA